MPNVSYKSKQIIVMRRDLKMRKGKIAAQAGHACVEATLMALAREGRLDQIGAVDGFHGTVYHGAFNRFQTCFAAHDQLRQPRLPHVQGGPAHRRAGEQLRLFGPLNLKFSFLFLPAVQLHGGELYYKKEPSKAFYCP